MWVWFVGPLWLCSSKILCMFVGPLWWSNIFISERYIGPRALSLEILPLTILAIKGIYLYYLIKSYISFTRFLSDTRVKMDICVFVLTCADFGDILIDLHKKGVVIRVVTDGEQVSASGSQINRLRAEGTESAPMVGHAGQIWRRCPKNQSISPTFALRLGLRMHLIVLRLHLRRRQSAIRLDTILIWESRLCPK